MTDLTAAIARVRDAAKDRALVGPYLGADMLQVCDAAAERAASAEQDAKRWIDLLSDAGMELARCKVFVGSREKMHPDGLILYQELLDRIDAAIDAARGAP